VRCHGTCGDSLFRRLCAGSGSLRHRRRSVPDVIGP
jgi:hypothetical protein